MAGKSGWMWVAVWAGLCGTAAMGARIRPGADPNPERVIWADPFDNYSQWAWDNQNNPAYQPQGTIWQGGPMPAGSPSGIYPRKSDDPVANPTNPDGGCGVVRQTSPSYYLLARQQWQSNLCPNITTPAGDVVGPATFWAGPDNFNNSTCTSGGWVETIAEYGRVDCVWQAASGYYTSLDMFTHDISPRIQTWSPLRPWDQSAPNAVQGTDEHPLTLTFDLQDSGNPGNPRAFVNNGYVELNLNDEHAPTDYIWRGDRTKNYESGDPECCPEGPYPIICQQTREVNEGNFEGPQDLQYLNDHCPSLVPPYDPQTQTGRTWSAIAFGFLAIGCKDPCTCAEQGVAGHLPTMNHPMLFDGNVWRELRSGRGTALTQCPPSWGAGPPWGALGPETTMQDSGGGASGNFSFGGGVHRVYLKLTTNKILIWMHTQTRSGGVTTEYDYCGAFDRVYKGPFNRISLGVGRGCELQDKATQGDSYTCKPGGTPTQCLTYSETTKDGYWRVHADSMVLLDGVLVRDTPEGACCKPDGTCEVLLQNACTDAGGVFRGANTSCSGNICNGACCLPLNECTDTAYGTCAGNFRGVGTSCAADGCPCPTPWADVDEDNDVDMRDFSYFQKCFNPSAVAPGCECYDRDTSGGIDLDDFTKFTSCAKGSNIPLTPAEELDCDTPIP